MADASRTTRFAGRFGFEKEKRFVVALRREARTAQFVLIGRGLVKIPRLKVGTRAKVTFTRSAGEAEPLASGGCGDFAAKVDAVFAAEGHLSDPPPAGTTF